MNENILIGNAYFEHTVLYNNGNFESVASIGCINIICAFDENSAFFFPLQSLSRFSESETALERPTICVSLVLSRTFPGSPKDSRVLSVSSSLVLCFVDLMVSVSST